ncbi:vitamin D 25-hydroxylase-like isoform X2 [Amphiura filiformis]|uniref:vitamin D 25-hydroxylase-like isoform X2 n=1 Tax=Amphiura filiformis TaxID=82378 RepID=UPI003B210271
MALIGYLPNLGLKIYRTGMQPYRVFAQLSAKYGKVYSLYMGRKLVVMINSADVAREAFKNPYLNGRPPLYSFPDGYLGHRKCLGEHLAKMELFIIFSHLLHQFTFKSPPDVELSMDGTLGVTNAPKPFQCVAIQRD